MSPIFPNISTSTYHLLTPSNTLDSRDRVARGSDSFCATYHSRLQPWPYTHTPTLPLSGTTRIHTSISTNRATTHNTKAISTRVIVCRNTHARRWMTGCTFHQSPSHTTNFRIPAAGKARHQTGRESRIFSLQFSKIVDFIPFSMTVQLRVFTTRTYDAAWTRVLAIYGCVAFVALIFLPDSQSIRARSISSINYVGRFQRTLN